MGEENKKDFTKYPEGLEYLAEHLELPVPKDADMETRKEYVFRIISILVHQ